MEGLRGERLHVARGGGEGLFAVGVDVVGGAEPNALRHVHAGVRGGAEGSRLTELEGCGAARRNEVVVGRIERDVPERLEENGAETLPDDQLLVELPAVVTDVDD